MTFGLRSAPPAPPSGVLERAWASLGTGPKLALVVLAAGLALWGIWAGVRRIGRGGRKVLLASLTAVFAAAGLSLGAWALRLPSAAGTGFVLWHQVVRVGAALSATGFALSGLGLALPRLLDAFGRLGFESFVAVRHVRSQKSGFLTVISVLSIMGVAVSSFALCAVVSIMGGFGADLKHKILGNNAHIRISSPDVGGFADGDRVLVEARTTPGVRAATPVVGGEAMASSSSNTAGVLLRGVDPESIGHVIDLLRNIEVGRFSYLTETDKLADLPPDEPIGTGPDGQRYLRGPRARSLLGTGLDPAVADAVRAPDVHPGIVLGRELAKTLHVYVGDEIRLVAPLGELGPMGVMPRTRSFRVAAIFYSGMYEYDASHAYVTLDVAQEFLDLPGRFTAVDVAVEDAEATPLIVPRLSAALEGQPLFVRDWKEMNRGLFSALKLEKIATFIVLSLAIAVASFCIVCTLLLMVTEKSKEIAILKSLGASDGAILRTFMAEGLIIGGIGTVFGVLTGLVACLGLERFGVRLDPEVYYVERLPIEVNGSDYVLVAVSALVITILATVYPAVSASRLRPVEGIRYE